MPHVICSSGPSLLLPLLLMVFRRLPAVNMCCETCMQDISMMGMDKRRLPGLGPLAQPRGIALPQGENVLSTPSLKAGMLAAV